MPLESSAQEGWKEASASGGGLEGMVKSTLGRMRLVLHTVSYSEMTGDR